MKGVGGGQRRFHLLIGGGICQLQETPYGQRQGPVDLELLRHIGGAEIRLLTCRSLIRLKNAECRFRGCGFAGPVRADQRDNLARLDAHGNTAHQPPV